MRFWPKDRTRNRGRLLNPWICGVTLVAAYANAQAPQPRPTSKKAAAQHVNESTLAGLRPGRDTLKRAEQLYKSPEDSIQEQGESSWKDSCHKRSLIVSYDHKQTIETIRVSRISDSIDADCPNELKRNPWRTGHGLAINDSTAKVLELYGDPDSKSPSTRGGQPLELWYYAFDWAGPEVPQVMEVLCTRKVDGDPGRVVEITLAAPSL
jgi:hypothetical protein